jgi:hypothetical protein
MYMYTYIHIRITLKPNQLIHLNIMCIWIGKLVTKLLHIEFIHYIYMFYKSTNLYLQT